METRPLPSSVNAEGPSKIRDATTHHKSALCCTLANHRGWVNASGPEKINQIKYLDQVLQANVVLNEGLARGYESEVSACLTRHCVWGISLINPTVEQNDDNDVVILHVVILRLRAGRPTRHRGGQPASIAS
jgi:hypothetical protein